MFYSRLSSLFFFGLLVAASFAMTGCEESCDDCQAAIDHMYSKLPDNGCNASFMAEAVDRINKNCNKENQNATYIVNCAVENCTGFSAAPPFCESPGVGIPLTLSLRFTDTGSPVPSAEMVLRLRRNGETLEQKSIYFVPNVSTYFDDWQFNDGDQLTLQLYNDEPIKEELTPRVEFDLRVRPSNIGRVSRNIRFGHDPATNEYTIETIYF